MKIKYLQSNEKGFTLIEIISVMVILGMLASVGAKKVDLLSDTADGRALLEGINELNSKEALVWTDMKLSDTGWTKDEDVFARVSDADIGSKYVWLGGPDETGGVLQFGSKSIALTRSASTALAWGKWQ